MVIPTKRDEIEHIVQNANSRSGACITPEECLKQINTLSPREAIEQFKEMLKSDQCCMEELQDHIAILWVLHDLGKIQFPDQDYGLALSVQNIAKMEKTELAARLLGFLEDKLVFIE